MKSVFGGPVRGHVQVELLSAYLDQQASPSERAYIDAHLQECMQCRAELDSLRRTVLLLHALPRVAMPRAFTLSEAQVGIRRPSTSPGWLGGLVRGLGAVAAILVVAFVAYTVLKPNEAPWNPSQTVARAAPTPAPQARVIATQPLAQAAPTEAQAQAEAPAAQAPTQAEAPPAGAQTQTEAPVAAPQAQPTPAPAPTSAPESPEPAALAAAPVEQPTESVADATAATAPLATGAASAETIAPADTSTAPPESAPLIAKAAPSVTATGTMGAAAAPETAATGRGGGGPSEPVGIPSQFLTPEPTPPGRPLADALPSGVRLAYSDLNALWAIDSDGSIRQLVQGQGINMPQLSPDQQWIVYRLYKDQGLQLWAVRWEGGEPKLLLDDAKLPAEGLPAGYNRRAISDTRWEPKGHVLAVTLSLIPDPDNPQPPKTELWQLDVETGTLKYMSDLGRAWRPYFSPDGNAYLVLQYGSDEKPEGTLTLVDAKSGKGKTILTFPASPGKNAYDNQVAWAPDSKTAWVAIPTADYGTPTPPNGTQLYRVNGSGGVKEIGKIDAAQVNWSPSGTAMSYTRYTDDTLAKNELFVANPDGSQARLYAPMNQGEFISWAPKGDRFIYQDNFQVFEGAPGQKPVRLANATSVYMPRWMSDTQILALQDTGDGWLLAVRDGKGDAAGLMPLPRESMWDVQSR